MLLTAEGGASSAKRARIRNFDAIRLFAALSVIFSHSFLIAEGTSDREPFQAATGEIAGGYGVYVFFVLSGYLITRSCLQSPSLTAYAWRRALRIYPAFAVSVLLGILVVAPLFSKVPPLEFLADPSVWWRVARTLLFDFRAYWFGDVLFYPDPATTGVVINGVLWTLSAEVLLYIAVAALYRLRLLNLTVTGLLCLLASIAHLTGFSPTLSLGPLGDINLWFLRFGAPGFFAGAFLFLLFRRQEPRGDVAALLGLAAITVPFLDLGDVLPGARASHHLFPVLVAYPLIWLGNDRAPDLGNWTRFGDLSYAIYIFGWPIQQVLRALTGEGWNGWGFFLLCLGPVVLAASLSWRLVEQPALRFRALFDCRRSSLAGTPGIEKQ